jgi:hypothetical protein
MVRFGVLAFVNARQRVLGNERNLESAKICKDWGQKGTVIAGGTLIL